MLFADLFSSYQAQIRRYILTMVDDLDEADDLTQEVFLRAHRSLGSLRDAEAAASWLYRIATHVCYDRFRKWSREPRPHSLDLTDAADAAPVADGGDAPSLARVIEQADMSACVRRYLDELSDDYRNVILLHDVEGVTNVEIAEMLGSSLDAIKIRLHRARRKLAEALAAHCDFSRDELAYSCATPPRAPPERRPERSRNPARTCIPPDALIVLKARHAAMARPGQEVDRDDVVER